MDKILNRLEYKNERVNIFDIKLEKVLHSGIFKGIDEYGQAILELKKEGTESETETKAIMDGRMRKR